MTKKSGLSQIGREDDAAVITDSDGTLSAFLRGLVKMFASGLSVAGMPASVGQKAMAASMPVVIASDQSAVPVVGYSDVLDVTLSLDTNIYADGDVLAATQAIANAVRVNGGTCLPLGIQVIDEDDQGIALDLFIFRDNISIGNENSAYSIDDAGSRDLLCWVHFATTDFTDFGGWRCASRKPTDSDWHAGPGLWEAAAASTSLYIAAVTRGGTPTYSASGIRLKIGVVKD